MFTLIHSVDTFRTLKVCKSLFDGICANFHFELFFEGVTVYTPTSILNQSHVIIMFQSGAGVEVVENNRHMSARVYLPLSYMVILKYFD